MLLDTINSVKDLRQLDVKELQTLADEIREYIINTVSVRGGHIASSLGVVELTVALHYVFNTPIDKIIWDVGHQCYAHKILTGRKEYFSTLRTYGGMSGFPKICESPFDVYNTGHSSTSLSLALGEAVGRDLNGSSFQVIAVIGDGSIAGGMAFEALNQIGHLKSDLIIILNDNEQFISGNVGALSTYLMKLITDPLYNRLRKRSYEIIKKIPKAGKYLYNFLFNLEENVKGIFIPNSFFDKLGIRYFGPVNGHNMQGLIRMLARIKEVNSGPRILHVITKKGKGYDPAEKNPARFHGVGPFDKKTGLSQSPGKISYSSVVGKTLSEISLKDKKVLAITAAMKLGTGLYEFEKKAPEKLFDVGIAEQHAITFAGALAASGLKPFVSIYSTFLQRAIDQLIHDIGIMNLPVRLLIDRAGIVGDDGETHHGLFDICLVRNIPNFIFLAPSNGEELRDMLYFAMDYNSGPLAIRFPRGSADADNLKFDEYNEFIPGRIRRLTHGKNVAILALGDMVSIALHANTLMQEHGIESSVYNILSIKPLDLQGMEKAIEEADYFITIENGVISGGVGEAILSGIKGSLRSKLLFHAGFPDEFITHGKIIELFNQYELDPESLARKIIKLVK